MPMNLDTENPQVLGGVNHTMYDGDIYNTSIVEELYYNIIITNLTVGSTVIDMDCTEVSLCYFYIIL